tara:strand:+ start:42 stop:488 length:447 start_codon:yes stop_codon:yes gene_type:complete
MSDINIFWKEKINAVEVPENYLGGNDGIHVPKEDWVDFYSDNSLWNDTSCHWGTQTLRRAVYRNVNSGELDTYDLIEQLDALNIDKMVTMNNLTVDMRWGDDDNDSFIEIRTVIYSYKDYLYSVNMRWSDGCHGYNMTREPQLNKECI